MVEGKSGGTGAGPGVTGATGGTGGRRLIGWKAIGHFLSCTERTARRWESDRSMPVHRIPGGGRSSVWASTDELRAWLQALPSEVQETLRAEAGSDTPASSAASGAGEPSPAASIASTASPPAIEPPRRTPWVLATLVVLGLIFVGGLAWNVARRAPPAAVTGGPYDDDPRAREAYMTARFELATRSAESLSAAEQGFHQLVESYPDRAAGWSGLADTLLLLREFGSMGDEVAYPQAERAARTALALDPKLADAWLDQAFVAWWWHGDPTSAFRDFDIALQLDPHSAKALHWYATALYAHGDYAKSLQTIGRARAIDPNSRAIVADEAWLRFGAGDHAAALATLERLVNDDRSFEASHFYLAQAYLVMGRDADFLREAKLAAELRRQAEMIDVLSLAEQRFLSGGRQGMLDQLSASEAERFERGTGSAVVVAEYRALANDREGMLSWLATAESHHDHNLPTLRGYPGFAAYRNDPAFVKVVQRLP